MGVKKSNYEKYATVKQQELLRKEINLQQAINCLDLYDLSIDEVKRAMDGEEYWCI